MPEWIKIIRKKTVWCDDVEDFLDFVLTVGENSFYHLIPDKDYGIFYGEDAYGHLRKYCRCICVICGHKYEVRYDHIINKSKRISRDGKDGTFCPYCASVLYEKINFKNVSGSYKKLVYFVKFEDDDQYHNKVGETKLPKKKLKIDIEAEQDMDSVIANTLIKKRFKSNLSKLPSFEVIDWYYSKNNTFIESHLKKYLKQEFSHLFEGISPSISKYFDGHTEVFLPTPEFTKKDFKQKCRQYDVLAQSADNLEELWLKRFEEMYGKEELATIHGQESIMSLLSHLKQKLKPESSTDNTGIVGGLYKFEGNKNKEGSLKDFF